MRTPKPPKRFLVRVWYLADIMNQGYVFERDYDSVTSALSAMAAAVGNVIDDKPAGDRVEAIVRDRQDGAQIAFFSEFGFAS